MWRLSGRVASSSPERPAILVVPNRFLYWLMHRGVPRSVSGGRVSLSMLFFRESAAEISHAALRERGDGLRRGGRSNREKTLLLITRGAGDSR